MSILELIGAAALYILGVFVLGLVLTWWTQSLKSVKQMELGALVVMNYTLIGTWIVGAIVGVFLLGMMVVR